MRRRPAWLPALAALFFAGLTFWLGQWQLGRAEEKQARQAAFDAAARLPVADIAVLPASVPPYTRARVMGRFDGTHQIFLDNRIHRGRAGYHVIAPVIHASGVVLVNRGWLAAGADRAAPLHAPPPADAVTLEGLLVPAQSRYVELSAQAVEGRVWQNLDLERFRSRYRPDYRPDLADRMLLQTSPAPDGLVRDWPRPDAGVERHVSYAVQWFSLTGAIAALYAYYGVWRRFHGPR